MTTVTPMAPGNERGYGALILDGRRLLVPQQEIVSLEPLLDMTHELQIPGAVGTLPFREAWWPVFCLSGNLDLLTELPDGRRYCMLLTNGEDGFGLACDQIEPLRQQPGRLQPLPTCMKLPHSPVQGLVVIRDGLGYVTDTASLAVFLEHSVTAAGIMEAEDGG